MSRHGYTDYIEDELAAGRWKGRVKSAIRGKRGQAFLKDLAAAMDEMPVKELIREELIDEDGQCCTIGVVCKARGLDVSRVDYEDSDAVGKLVDIAGPMAAEIEYWNDDGGDRWGPDASGKWGTIYETDAERWARMREWVAKQIRG